MFFVIFVLTVNKLFDKSVFVYIFTGIIRIKILEQFKKVVFKID